MISRAIYILIASIIVFSIPLGARAQNVSNPEPGTNPSLSCDYPKDRPGILIHSSDWISVSSESPTKTHLKHGLAPALTYGIAPAAVVAEYAGAHAHVQIEPGQPVICVCRVLGLPGDPVLVRLHEKNNLRELDGGNLHIRGKMTEAQKNDLVEVKVSQPQTGFWLVQPQQVLSAGEYALMLGTQNMSIFPFTVAASPATAPPPAH